MKDKKYRKVRDHWHYTGEYSGAAHSICNLKYSVIKNVPIISHNGSSYDYHFIIKELAKESKKQFTCLVPMEKEVARIDKNGEESRKKISSILQFIDSQNLWQAHYQIFSIIFLKEFIELSVNLDLMIKNVKLVELNISIATVVLNT